MSKSELNQVRAHLHAAGGDLAYSLEIYGDALAKREGYGDINGIEAIHLYLVLKHHWMPKDVRAMNFDDLRFVLTQELAGFRLPADAKD